jgi:3-methyladenine DNA glycosylase AlkD
MARRLAEVEAQCRRWEGQVRDVLEEETMATLKSVMGELKAKGSEKTRAIYVRHGMPADRVYGVSVADLKVILKSIKGDQALAMELYSTGNMDAMYLAGMVADGARMTKAELQAWAEGADGMPMIADYTVPWVTVENAAGSELAMKWIGSKNESVASAGWGTYAGLVAVTPDEALDLKEIEALLARVVKEIGGAKNRVRSAMNRFVISVGSYVAPLVGAAKKAAVTMGDVSVDVGDTACKVPVALEYIAKVEAMGRVGKKRKTMRC